MSEKKAGLWGYTEKWYQSRANWVVILGAVLTVVEKIFPEFPLEQETLLTIVGLAWAFFTREGIRNMEDAK